MKLLAIDVETRPAVVYTWTLWQANIGVNQIIDPGGVFSFAAKWVGERPTIFLSDHHDGHEEMVKKLWELLDEAEAVLHFNGDRFDIPHICREFMEAGMPPPSPHKSIDLLKTVKRRGRFISNKLEHIAPQLGLRGKVSHEGFALWKKCLAGDEAAWRKMRRYNVRDVTELEALYKQLLPWISNHPNQSAIGERICPRCGGSRLERRGYTVLTTGRYGRLRCKDCGGWSREKNRESSAEVIPL